MFLSVFWQQIKFKSQLEQQRLQLQREHSSEMEQILEKVSNSWRILSLVDKSNTSPRKSTKKIDADVWPTSDVTPLSLTRVMSRRYHWLVWCHAAIIDSCDVTPLSLTRVMSRRYHWLVWRHAAIIDSCDVTPLSLTRVMSRRYHWLVWCHAAIIDSCDVTPLSLTRVTSRRYHWFVWCHAAIIDSCDVIEWKQL